VRREKGVQIVGAAFGQKIGVAQFAPAAGTGFTSRRGYTTQSVGTGAHPEIIEGDFGSGDVRLAANVLDPGEHAVEGRPLVVGSVWAVDGDDVSPRMDRMIDHVEAVIGRIIAAGAFLDEEVEGLAHFPIQRHMRMAAFTFARKMREDSLRVGGGNDRMQVGGGVPDGKNGPAIRRAEILDAAVALNSRPICTTEINRRVGSQNGDRSINAGDISRIFGFPIELFGCRPGCRGSGAAKDQYDEKKGPWET